jgi:predicted nucleotidyltransferase
MPSRHTSGNELAEEEAKRFARCLATACSLAFGDAIDGVVLHGSLALGDYRPGRSDIDLLAVVAGPLADDEVTALTQAIAAEAADTPVRVDLRVVTRHVAASPTPTPAMELAIEIRPGSEPPLRVERDHPGERDLVPEFSLCRAIGRALVGPSPAALIADIPIGWVLDCGDAQLADWQAIGDDPPYAQLTALTACRIWRFAEEHVHCSKAAAGRWALERDPSLAAVREALHQREVDRTASIEAAEVQRLLRIVRERIAAARATAG